MVGRCGRRRSILRAECQMPSVSYSTEKAGLGPLMAAGMGLLMFFGSAQAGSAQTTTRPAPLAVAPARRAPEYAATARVPESLLNQQAGSVIVLPSEPGEADEDRAQLSGGALARLQPEPQRLPEGYLVARRPARLERQEDGWVVHLAPVEKLPDVPPLSVLPNRRLEVLESVLGEMKELPRFQVTGRVTEFRGRNYFLIENLAEITTHATKAPEVPESAVETAPAVQPSGTGPATEPGREPTAEEIVKQLMESRPLRPVMAPNPSPPAGTQASPEVTPGDAAAGAGGLEEAFKNQTRWREDTLLSDRLARIVPGDPGYMLAFEDAGRHPQDRPIRVLPNRLLETALALTGAGTRSVVLVVSGEVTAYRGTNYLLLRKVLVRRDYGNLR